MPNGTVLTGAAPNKYAAWGNQADTAQKQGFYPTVSYGDATIFKSNYTPVFNNVEIPGAPNEKGDVAFIGHNNQRFDVVIRDKQGNIRHTIFSGISPDQVQKYITDSNSGVATRNNVILKKATPIDIAVK